MDYSFIIRKAVPEDAEAIKLILQESFKKYMRDTGLVGTMEALEETVDCIKSEIEAKEAFVAFINGAPAGAIRVEILPDNTAYISRFGVRPQYQNIGIGKGLMSIVDKLLISKGVKKVCLHTASKYKDLVRFYYGRGFYVDSTSRVKGYIRALMVKEYCRDDL
jgi:ribosomal protein S18 acetylase RimI-like enzyme